MTENKNVSKKSVQKPHAGHRSRLYSEFLTHKLSDEKLLELYLMGVIARRDVKPIARTMLKTFGNLAGVLTADYNALVKCPGVGRAVAIHIMAVKEIILRGYKYHLSDTPIFHNVTRFYDYCKWLTANKTDEEFHVFYLSEDHKLIEHEVHSVGVENETAVYWQKILTKALVNKARSVALMHNHPTPGLSFSTPDVEMTLQLQEKLTAVDVRLFDHVVVSGGIAHSMRDRRVLND